MRISDWSSDVCSSDLNAAREIREQRFPAPICLAVHGLFASDAEAMLRDLGCRLVTTDSIPHSSNAIALAAILGNALAGQVAPIHATRLRIPPQCTQHWRVEESFFTDRKSDGEGKRVSVRGDPCGWRRN